MELYIRNQLFELVGVIDNAASIIWTNRFYEAGDFEIYLAANAFSIELLKPDFYVTRTDDDMVGIIENIKLTTDEEQGDYLTVTGHCAKALLKRRIVWEQTNIFGTVENGIRKLVNENAIAPIITSRKIPRFALSEPRGFTDRVDRQFTGNNLYEVIVELCRTYRYGWKITWNDQKSLFELEIYKGIDRSDSQDENPHVKFSPEFDNLVSSEYALNSDNYKNVALVAGEGEGTARKTQEIGEAEGLDRFETYVDARDVSSNDGEIDATTYNQLLHEKGYEILSEAVISETFSGEVISGQTYSYKRDYFLGDTVTTENQYNMAIDTQVTEIIESEDQEGYKVIPTLENWT